MQLNEGLSPALLVFINDETGASVMEFAILAALVAVVSKLFLLVLYEGT